MKKFIFIFALVCGLFGCASYEPIVPAGYPGPIAKISDHGHSEDSTKSQLFYLAEVDGRPVETSLVATRRASSGQGFSLSTRHLEHIVPAKPLRLKLVGTHVTAAPIHELASRAVGTFFSVEGEVSFTPIAGHEYFVTGKLLKEGSSVWIADAEAESIPVTAVIYEGKR